MPEVKLFLSGRSNSQLFPREFVSNRKASLAFALPFRQPYREKLFANLRILLSLLPESYQSFYIVCFQTRSHSKQISTRPELIKFQSQRCEVWNKKSHSGTVTDCSQAPASFFAPVPDCPCSKFQVPNIEWRIPFSSSRLPYTWLLHSFLYESCRKSVKWV